ncbi:hypothetical protein [uncultured Gordonia sp.]|uniref:hypothetical protein n=1 Tax=uncultured Gordonia sp. TaxID=198437 RepID=UPI00261312CD|nr:hypothetical protein [uncultured Gordonia sp.]
MTGVIRNSSAVRRLLTGAVVAAFLAPGTTPFAQAQPHDRDITCPTRSSKAFPAT